MAATNTVHYYQVVTPNPEFNGVRRKVVFSHGEARLPVPRTQDFKSDREALEREQVALDALVNGFIEDGYAVESYRATVTEPVKVTRAVKDNLEPEE